MFHEIIAAENVSKVSLQFYFIISFNIYNSYMSLVVFLYLCIDSPLSGGLVQLPLGDLEEVGGLPESHLP